MRRKGQHIRRHSLSGVMVVLMAIAVLLGGCSGKQGKAKEDDLQVTSDAGEADLQETYVETREPIAWEGHTMTTGEKAELGEQWYLTGYDESWIKEPTLAYDRKYSEQSGLAGDFCALTQYVKQQEEKTEVWYSLDYFDGNTKASSNKELVWEQLGVDGGAGNLDLIAPNKVAFTCKTYELQEEEQALTGCTAVFYHMEQGMEKKVDLMPALQELGIEIKGETLMSMDICHDKEYNSYVMLDGKVLVVNQEGERSLLMEPTVSSEFQLKCICKTPEGVPVFAVMDMMNLGNTYFCYDVETGTMRTLGQNSYLNIYHTGVDGYGSIYYFSERNLVSWDTVTGKQEKIFDCKENAICNNSLSALIGYNEAGEILIMDPQTDKDNIYVLSRIAPPIQGNIVLENTTYGMNDVQKSAAAIFSRKNPGINVEYKSFAGDGDRDAYRDRVIMEMMAGNGPDMMIVNAEDMVLLHEKGLLADLSDVFSAELRSQVFGGIWNGGTIDGALVGLATEIYQTSVLVSKEVWEEPTWTLDDILQLMEERTEEGIGIFPIEPDGQINLLSFLLYDIDASLVDWEKGTCKLDGEKFRRILQLCKEAPTLEGCENYEKHSAVVRAVKNGEFLCKSEYVFSFSQFSQYMAMYGEDFHWVGFPTEGESGGYLTSASFLVVNRETEHMESIRDFLQLMYSEEIQRSAHECLRKDLLREYTFIPEWDTKAQFSQGQGVYVLLECKPDGSSYVEEYIDFMDKGILWPVRDEEIRSIILEEAEAYFVGDKDLDTTVNIIQSRAQLFLNENK